MQEESHRPCTSPVKLNSKSARRFCMHFLASWHSAGFWVCVLSLHTCNNISGPWPRRGQDRSLGSRQILFRGVFIPDWFFFSFTIFPRVNLSIKIFSDFLRRFKASCSVNIGSWVRFRFSQNKLQILVGDNKGTRRPVRLCCYTVTERGKKTEYRITGLLSKSVAHSSNIKKVKKKNAPQ